MIPDLLEFKLTVVVENKKTLCTPFVTKAFKNGIHVLLGTLLKPNSGLDFFSQFHQAVYASVNYVLPVVGPSPMVSVTPVHKLTAVFQFDVKDAAAVAEQSGSTIFCSITDKYKTSQLYCKLFDRPSESECPAADIHLLDRKHN
ncbi:polyphosphoinositide phosphatase [Plakobranchus ocellatus]|uniref:Polyphosphoinositide phosphatase n=1 Tax=Plakobranchus ocellatus TaxID=259542 RepID=A0AAV4DM66_9GAST|nr:polyphosphoinositide phosphatase [Plakobranchus ocellatus]